MQYRKKKGSYKFTDKKHPIDAIVAFIVALVVLIALCVISYKSAKLSGNGPISYGTIGVMGMILSLAGFITSVVTLKQKEIYYLFPILGGVFNGVLFIGLFVIYMIGASI